MLLKTVLIVSTVVFAWALIAPACMTFRVSDEYARKQFGKKGLDLHAESIQVNGHALHYTMVGLDTLPTIIFIHGSPSAWNAFIKYMHDPKLLFHFRMVSVDRPGFGFSDFGYALPLSEQSLHMIPLLKHIENGKPVYLVGHSLGGPLAVKMAADAPGEIDGIMLLAGSVDPALEPKESWRYLAEKFPFKHLMPGAFRPSNTELLYFKKDVIALADDFSKVRCSVVLLHGDKDTWVPVGNVDYAQQKLVNASAVETEIFPGGNHFIPWTKKTEITDWILKMGKQ